MYTYVPSVLEPNSLMNLAADQAGSSSDDTATIALAVGLGVGVPFFLIVVIVAAVAIIMAVIVKKRQWGNDNWEISPSELEMEDHLGTGGYALCSHMCYDTRLPPPISASGGSHTWAV
jgi:hypothetical protein